MMQTLAPLVRRHENRLGTWGQLGKEGSDFLDGRNSFKEHYKEIWQPCRRK